MGALLVVILLVAEMVEAKVSFWTSGMSSMVLVVVLPPFMFTLGLAFMVVLFGLCLCESMVLVLVLQTNDETVNDPA